MQNINILSTIADHVPSLVVMYNITTGRYLYVNKTVKKLLGYDPEDFINGGFAFASSIVHPEDFPLIMAKNQKALEEANAMPTASSDQDPIISFEYRMRHKNGSYRWFQTDGTVFGRSALGKVELVLNVSIDITERKKTEQALIRLNGEIEQQAEQRSRELVRTLRESEEHFRSLIQAVEDYAIFSMDLSGKITSWNEGVEYILGYTQDEIIGKHYSILFTLGDISSGKHEEELEIVKTNGSMVKELLQVRKDGGIIHAVVTCTALKDEQGQLKGYTKIIRDITEKKEAEETIRYQAFHDSLTGLSNRESLFEKFNLVISNAERHNYKIALMFLDLDRFKVINDTLGHETGDLILKEAADRLTHSVRKNDVVARLGGDEFILLLTEAENEQDLLKVAQKILQAFEPVIRVRNRSLHISTSIGIAVYPEDGEDIHTLLKNADTALYRAKDTGRNRFQFYNLNMNLKSVEKLSMEQGLRLAVAESQLEMVYQPYVEISNGKVKGAEALVRWNHPTLGVICPGDFIPLAEEIGMITPIGNWILKAVCAQGKAWHDQGLKILASVNISARQFAEEKFVENVCRVLEETGYDHNYLELEITESVAMENITRTSAKLQELKEMGILISIDDFGTGYSSLNYLKKFPVHKLKIDQSFINNAIQNPQDQAIVKAIISMGQSLGLTVCAEGIETLDQLEMLSLLECNLAQGYFISKPLPAQKVSAWYKSHEPIKPANSPFPIT